MDKNIKIQYYKKINITNIRLDKPIEYIHNSNKYISKCKYINKNLYIQTPKLKLNNDINVNDENIIFQLDFVSDNITSDFYIFFNNLEKYLIDEITKNSKIWFGIEFDKLKTEQLFTSNIKNQQLILNINNKINQNLFNDKNEKINLNKIVKESKLIFILNLKEIILEKDKFSINWIINRIKICNNIDKYLFIDDMSNDEEYIYNIIDYEIKETLSDIPKNNSNIITTPIINNIINEII